MNFNRFLPTTLITSVALLAPLSSVLAQTKAGPVSTATAPRSVELATPSAVDPPSLNLRINGGNMAVAVEELQSAMEAAGNPPINVLFGPGVQEVPVPTLTLRKVSGADALNLIAVSAGCFLETIRGEKVEVVGYQILAGNPPRGEGVAGVGPAGIPAPNDPNRGARPKNAPLAARPLNAGITPSGITQSTPTGGQPMTPGSNAVISFTSPVQPGPNVRVYALGEITMVVKFTDVEKTLQELLKAGGIPLEAGKLSLHEKTNVLVVTGEPRVHELVSQFLDALQRNTLSAASQRSRDEDARRQTIEYKMRLEAGEMEMARLQERLKDSEVELTKLRRELDRANTTGSPKAQ